MNQQIKDEIDDIIAKKYPHLLPNKDKTVTTNNSNTPSIEDKITMAVEGAKEADNHLLQQKQQAEIESLYTQKLVYPSYKCECGFEQICRLHGAESYNGHLVSEVHCIHCGRISYVYFIDNFFNKSHFGMNPNELAIDFVEKEINKLQKFIDTSHKKSILKRAKELLIGINTDNSSIVEAVRQ